MDCRNAIRMPYTLYPFWILSAVTNVTASGNDSDQSARCCAMLEAEEDEPLLATEDPPFKSSGRLSQRFRKETNPDSTKMASGTLVPSAAAPTKGVRWADGVQKDPTGPTGQAVEPATTSAVPSLHQAIAAYNAGGASTLSLAGQVAACKAASRASSASGVPNLKDAVENYMATARQRKAADAVYPATGPDATQARGGLTLTLRLTLNPSPNPNPSPSPSPNPYPNPNPKPHPKTPTPKP